MFRSFIFLSIFAAHYAYQLWSDSLSRDAVDICVRDFMFPKNVCDASSLPCIERFSHHSVKKFVSEARASVGQRCANSSDKCSSANVIECVDVYTATLESIRDSVQNDLIVGPYTCCAFKQYQKCTEPCKSIVTPFEQLSCPESEVKKYKCHNLVPLIDDVTTGEAVSPLSPLLDIRKRLTPDKCGHSHDAIDEAASRLLIVGDRAQRFADRTHHCKVLHESIAVMREQSSCIHNQREIDIINAIIEGANATVKHCAKPVEHARCLDSNIRSLHSCYDRFVAGSSHGDICCRIGEFKKCVSNAAEQNCKASAQINTIIEEVFDPLIKQQQCGLCKRNDDDDDDDDDMDNDETQFVSFLGSFLFGTKSLI